MDTPTLKSDSPAEVVACAECKGSGRVGANDCHRCFGVGRGALVGGMQVFWGHALHAARLQEEHTQGQIRFLIRGVAFFFAFLGLLFFSFSVLVNVELNRNIFTSLLTRGWTATFFWLGVLADLFIFANLERDLERTVKIPRRVYQSRRNGLAALTTLDIWETMTSGAQQAMIASELRAKTYTRPCRGADLFVVVLANEGVRLMLARLGISFERLSSALASAAKDEKLVSSEDMGAILLEAYTRAYEDRQLFLDVPYLFMAIAVLDPMIREVLFALNVDATKVKNVLLWQQHDERRRNAWRRFSARARLRPHNRLDRAMTAVATPIIDHFATDYTELAQWGQFQPAVSRPEVTEAILRVMSGGRSTILVGFPGVGKMGVLEDVAERMVSNDVPEILQDKRLLSVSIAKLVSGVTPAEAEGRLMALVEEAARSGNIVIVFEEIQGMVGITSGGEGSVDLGSALASTLGRSNLLCIATAIPEAYRKYVQPTALGQVLEYVELSEPTTDESIRIVESRVGVMEYRHRVYFSYDAIATLVELTVRYIHDRYLPKKALDFLNEISLAVRERYGVGHVISASDVESYVATKLNLPVTRVSAEESDVLLSLEARLHERLVDQEEAVSAVANALRRARAEMRDRQRPVASFLFLGPTGVGKTELAKAVAAVYFGDDRHTVRLDMTEYQELNSLSRLIGTATTPGVLTEAIRTSPFALVLLDEIEKAHRDVINVFLQVMDDARLTDATGVTIDCSNIILIATSNAAAPFILESLRQKTPIADIQRALMERELKAYFQPEFLNRFDGVIVFKPLEMEQVEEIVRRMLREVTERLQEQHGVVFEVDPIAVHEIAELGFDPLFGARPLRRLIQDRIDASLAKLLLSHEVGRRDTVRLEAGVQLRVISAAKL